jgi:hypothetical protein
MRHGRAPAPRRLLRCFRQWAGHSNWPLKNSNLVQRLCWYFGNCRNASTRPAHELLINREFHLACSLLLLLNVTLKIETIRGKEGTSIKLIGRLCAEALPDLEAEIKASARVIALEMDEIAIVDLDVVRFLSACEIQGIELRGCPPYIRQWIAQEKESGNP